MTDEETSPTAQSKSILGFLSASVGYLLIQFLLTPVRIRVLTSILSKEQYGALTLITMTVFCATVVISLGSFEYILRHVPGRDRDYQLGLLGQTFRIFGGGCVVLTIVAVALLMAFSRAGEGLAPMDTFGIGVAVLLYFILLHRTYFLLGCSKLVPFRIAQFLYADIWFISLLVVSSVVPLTLTLIIWTWAAWLGLSVMATGRWLPLRDALRPRKPVVPLAEILHFGVPLLPMVFGEWLFRLGDRYLLLAYMDLKAVANYSLCMNIALIVYLVGMSLIGLILPELNKARNEMPPDASPRSPEAARMRELITVMLRYGLSLSLAGAAALSLVGPQILAVLSDPEFHDAAFIFPWAAPASVFFLLQVIFTRTLMAMGRTRLVGALTVMAALLNLALNSLLIPVLEERGAALSTVISLALLAVGSGVAARVHQWVDWPRLMPMRIVLVSAGCAGGIYAARQWLPDNAFLILTAGGLVCAGLIFGSGVMRLRDIRLMIAAQSSNAE